MKARPIGFILIGIFLFISTGILYFAAFTLLYPGTSLDGVWNVNKKGYELLIQYKEWAGIGFLALSIPMLVAAIGWNNRKKWGWVLTVGIFSANGLADAARIFTGEYIEGSIGLVVAGAIVFYLTRPFVKQFFFIDA